MPVPKTPKGGHPDPGPTPPPPRGGSGQSERDPREVRIRVENAGGAEWRQAIGKALGVPLGAKLPTLDEAVMMVETLMMFEPSTRAELQLCAEDDCLNIAYRKFAFCHDHIFRSKL